MAINFGGNPTPSDVARTSVDNIFTGSNNLFTNQTAVSGSSLMTRALADQRLLDSLWSGRITRYTLTGWRTAVTGGGAVRTWPDSHGGLVMRCGAAGGTAIATACGLATPAVFTAIPGSDVRYINYSVRFRVFVKFGEIAGLGNNSFYYLRYDQAPGVSPTIGDPSARSVGFKVVSNGGGVHGLLFGVIHDGTNLNISETSFGAINNRVSYGLLIDSLGNGTVNYYLNGSLVGTMTGGPTGLTASGVYNAHFGISSGGDANDATLGVADLQVMVGDF